MRTRVRYKPFPDESPLTLKDVGWGSIVDSVEGAWPTVAPRHASSTTLWIVGEHPNEEMRYLTSLTTGKQISMLRNTRCRALLTTLYVENEKPSA